MPKPTPWDIAIRLGTDDDYDLTHAYIEVKAAYDPTTGKHTYAETLAGYRWCGGILGRLSLSLTDRLSKTRHGHACNYPEDCSTAYEEYHASEAANGGPILTITIPHDVDHDDWMEAVSTTLDALVESDQWEPTAEDQAEWSA